MPLYLASSASAYGQMAIRVSIMSVNSSPPATSHLVTFDYHLQFHHPSPSVSLPNPTPPPQCYHNFGPMLYWPLDPTGEPCGDEGHAHADGIEIINNIFEHDHASGPQDAAGKVPLNLGLLTHNSNRNPSTNHGPHVPITFFSFRVESYLVRSGTGTPRTYTTTINV